MSEATPEPTTSPHTPSGAAGDEPVRTASAWRRLATAGRPRGNRETLLAALLALLLGFAVVTQVHQTRSQPLAGLRQTDLVGILDNLNDSADRLDEEVRDLQVTRDRLRSGTADAAGAVAAAQKRLDALRILAGTVAATGPGVRITITDSGGVVTAALLLDAVQELRDAGAESIQLGTVRIVASSYLTDSDAGPTADGVRLSSPYLLVAIGDAQTLASAMSIPGGIVETVRQQGAEIQVATAEKVSIDALHTPRTPRYASPQPAQTP